MKNISQEVRQELAARYVLGIMHGKARQRFERWLMESFELRQEIWFWERELNNLPLLSEDSPPPQRVWKNIEHQLNGHSTKEKTWKRTSLFGGALDVRSRAFQALNGDPVRRRIVGGRNIRLHAMRNCIHSCCGRE